MPAGRRAAAGAALSMVLAVGVLAIGVLAGCAGQDTAAQRSTMFLCPDGTVLLATFVPGEDEVHLWADGHAYDLPREISASGARYSDGTATFWTKGDDALFRRPNARLSVGCIAHAP
jgi:membrane-bound inhibitor of C-type lysozyme